MKKKCIVVTNFIEGQIGYLDFIYRLRAISENYHTTLIGSFFPKTTEFSGLNCKYTTVSLGKGRVGWLHYLFQVSRLIKREAPNLVVLLHSSLSPLVLLLKEDNISLYWNEHPTHISPNIEGGFFIKNIFRSFLRFLLFKGARSCHCVMAIGEAHYEDLLAHGCNENQINLIYMGVSDDFRQSYKKALQEKIEVLNLIYIGTVSKARGRDVMLEAIAKANADMPRAILTIVGASKEQASYCNEYVKELGVSDEVNIIERVSGEKIPGYLENMDFGLCLWEDKPWWRFNPPTKLFEYLVAGVPVLASNIRTHTEYITDWNTGIIFEYNSESLSQKIIEVYAKKTALVELKKHAAIEGEKFLWSDIEPVFLSVLEQKMKKSA